MDLGFSIFKRVESICLVGSLLWGWNGRACRGCFGWLKRERTHNVLVLLGELIVKENPELVQRSTTDFK